MAASPGGTGLVIANPVLISRMLPEGSSDSTERSENPSGRLKRSRSSPVSPGSSRSGIHTLSPRLLMLMTVRMPAWRDRASIVGIIITYEVTEMSSREVVSS